MASQELREHLKTSFIVWIFLVLVTAIMLFLIVMVAPIVAPFIHQAFGIENENGAPAAFVEGTRDYSIPYLEKMRKEVLSKYLSNAELKHFDVSLAELKSFNGRMLERVKALKSRDGFLKENDPELVRYREALARTTDVMFKLLQKLNERNTLPSR